MLLDLNLSKNLGMSPLRTTQDDEDDEKVIAALLLWPA